MNMYNQNKYLVDIRCFTFQHVNYISDALNGFCIQKTSFPFIILVVDDASTDGEQEVICNYMSDHFNVTDEGIAWRRETEDGVYSYAQHKTNKNCFMMALCLRKNLHAIKGAKMKLIAEWRNSCKYEALCEGDDYWTDPLKLQRQVDFLEEHEEYSLCCHRYKIFEEDGNVWKPDYVVDLFEQNPDGFSFTSTDNLYHWITKTMTIMYRKSALPNGYGEKYRYCRDVHMNYHLLQNGPGYCMPNDMAVYRRHGGGVFSPLNNKEKKRINLLVYHEILEANPNDAELGIYLKACYDRYFGDFVRKPLYNHQINQEVRKDIQLVVDGYKFWMGRKSNFFVLKKCVKSFYGGFRRKNGQR